MNRRNKTGGIRDQRFGEDDATMSYEEKMAQRFVREKQGHKASMFDLEDDGPIDGLTHMGKYLPFDDIDDFEETDLLDAEGSESGNESAGSPRGQKRVRGEDDIEEEDDENMEKAPERKKTKQEIYKEIIAKSKLHKAERQAQKEDDEDLREEVCFRPPTPLSPVTTANLLSCSSTKNFTTYSPFYFQSLNRKVKVAMRQL
jgi:nucleolar protein 14